MPRVKAQVLRSLLWVLWDNLLSHLRQPWRCSTGIRCCNRTQSDTVWAAGAGYSCKTSHLKLFFTDASRTSDTGNVNFLTPWCVRPKTCMIFTPCGKVKGQTGLEGCSKSNNHSVQAREAEKHLTTHTMSKAVVKTWHHTRSWRISKTTMLLVLSSSQVCPCSTFTGLVWSCRVPPSFPSSLSSGMCPGLKCEGLSWTEAGHMTCSEEERLKAWRKCLPVPDTAPVFTCRWRTGVSAEGQEEVHYKGA